MVLSIKTIFLIFTIVISPLLLTQSFASSHDEQLSGSGITLDVTTDKESYNPGEAITISGQVNPQIPGTDVILQIVSPNNNIVHLEQLEVSSDGNFSGSIETSFVGLWKNSGTYELKAFYWKDTRVSIQFDYGMTSVGMQEPTEEIEESIQNEVLQSSEIVNVEVQDSILIIEGIDVNYTIAGGKIISVTPDLDAKSLIIKISTTNDGELVITLPKDVIDTDEQGFFILVDGEETAFLEELHDSSRTLTIPFYNGTEEIEIIGTFVIPEFGTIVVLALAISIVGIIAITAKSRLSLVPKL